MFILILGLSNKLKQHITNWSKNTDPDQNMIYFYLLFKGYKTDLVDSINKILILNKQQIRETDHVFLCG